MEGKFIVIEGLDGSGTTTQARLLAGYLFEKGKQYIPFLTREPTMLTPFGQELRRRLKNQLLPGEIIIHDSEYWANLYINDRRWHLQHIVEPNLAKGVQVISDRHMLSTLAYQTSQGGSMSNLIEKHQTMRKPDLTIFLRVPLETALQRIGIRKDGTEYFEKKEMLAKIHQAYEEAIQQVKTQQNIVIVATFKSYTNP
ncbi:MAG: dTMP kinase [Nanoarchaeota archaeon]|nr:dTMP kinase [Nanoarchaeota archaeon]